MVGQETAPYRIIRDYVGGPVMDVDYECGHTIQIRIRGNAPTLEERARRMFNCYGNRRCPRCIQQDQHDLLNGDYRLLFGGRRR